MTKKMIESEVQWIGEIPSTWGKTKVKNFVRIRNGKDNITKEGDIPVYGSGGKFGYTDNFIFDKESVLLGRKGTIDKPKFITEPFWAVDTAFFTEIKSGMNLKFFYYCMLIIDYKQYIYGSAIPSMSQSILNDIYLPAPGIETQQKIVYFLDQKVSQIDSIIEDTKQSIQEFKKYKQSLVTEAITKGLSGDAKMIDSGIEWIGEMPEHWLAVKTKRLFYIKKNIANEEGHQILSVTQQGLKVKDISKNEGQIATNYSKYQFVNVGDFVMNHMDLLTGWVDNSGFEGVTSPDYRVFRLIDSSNYMNDYYEYIFQACYSNKIYYGLGQGVSNLGRWRLQTDKFLNFVLPVPPLKEQHEIAKHLDEKCAHIENLIEQKQQLLIELETYKKSFIYEYVTGKKEVL